MVTHISTSVVDLSLYCACPAARRKPQPTSLLPRAPLLYTVGESVPSRLSRLGLRSGQFGVVLVLRGRSPLQYGTPPGVRSGHNGHTISVHSRLLTARRFRFACPRQRSMPLANGLAQHDGPAGRAARQQRWRRCTCAEAMQLQSAESCPGPSKSRSKTRQNKRNLKGPYAVSIDRTRLPTGYSQTAREAARSNRRTVRISE